MKELFGFEEFSDLFELLEFAAGKFELLFLLRNVLADFFDLCQYKFDRRFLFPRLPVSRQFALCRFWLFLCGHELCLLSKRGLGVRPEARPTSRRHVLQTCGSGVLCVLC